MKIFTEYVAEEFLEKKGFPVVQRKIFTDLNEARNYAGKIGFPVVLKLSSDELLHKTEVNAVKLDVHTDNFEKEFFKLSKMKIKHNGVVVQKFVNGKYVIIGVKKDPTFGDVMLVGIGGIFAEVIKDVSFRVLPINRIDAFEMLKELKGYEVLVGFRAHKININSVINVMLKTSKLAMKNKNIEELDINPLVVNENKSFVVDARIVFS